MLIALVLLPWSVTGQNFCWGSKNNHPSVDKSIADGTFENKHKDIDNVFNTKKGVFGTFLPNMEKGGPHPPITAMAKGGGLIAEYPDTHPNIDRICAGTLPLIDAEAMYPGHPNINYNLRQGGVYPASHPKMHAVLEPVMPLDHPNIDDMLQNGGYLPDLPEFHPDVNVYANVPLNAPNTTTNTTNTTGGNFCWGTFGGHPSVDANLRAGTFINPKPNHEDVDDVFLDPKTGQTLLPIMDDGDPHPAITAIIRSGQVIDYPDTHPNVDNICAGMFPLIDTEAEEPGHPNINLNIKAGNLYSDGHILVHDILFPVLTLDHPNIDEMLTNGGYTLPEYHPDVNIYVNNPANAPLTFGGGFPTSAGMLFVLFFVSVFVIVAAVKLSQKALSSSGRSAMNLQDGRHPSVMVSSDFVKSVQSMEGTDTSYSSLNTSFEDANVKATKKYKKKGANRGLSERRADALRKSHKGVDLYDFEPMGNTVAMRSFPKKFKANNLAPHVMSSCGKLDACLDVRLFNTQWTVGQVLFCIGYSVLNVVMLFVSNAFKAAPDTFVDAIRNRDAWGTLAAANTMLLIIPATRNGILTWGLGIPFDHAVMYHRFLGRFTLLVVIIHMILYLPVTGLGPQYQTGFIALGFAVFIFLTSLEVVRRRFFQIFFWTHFSFIGYFVAAYMHVPQTRIYVLIAATFYLLDRLLRMAWVCPRRTLVFKNKTDDVTQVRFPRPLLARQEMGQYFFVNFPQLSWTEWHPFSVSSSPREATIELHIRNLGDHTSQIVQSAKAIEAEAGRGGRRPVLPLIRIDGPYGNHPFEYRRYPALMLAAGGVGVTPVMGILKDIYNVGDFTDYEHGRVLAHCIDVVYFVWVIPNVADFEMFRKELEEIARVATLGQKFPVFRPLVYITKAKKKNLPEFNLPEVPSHPKVTGARENPREPMNTGRPRFDTIFNFLDDGVDCHPSGSAMCFACGPSPMVAEVWDRSLQRTNNGIRTDFNHETFEF